MELKRDVVKYCRDKAKNYYSKDSSCYRCGETKNLEFHHLFSMSNLLHKWIKEKGFSQDQVLEFRDQFISENWDKIYNETVTLCKECHKKLHSIYGQRPHPGTAEKQKRWLNKQRIKHGLDIRT